MRYSVDVAGVAQVVSQFSTHFEDVQAGVNAALNAVDAAAGSFSSSASDVARALDNAFATRRLTGPGLSIRAEEVSTAVRDATVAYVAGDEQMAVETSTRADVSEPSPLRRGFGPRVF